MTTAHTRRPLSGEPLGLDLLNTQWMEQGAPVDLLTDLAGTQQWLTEAAATGTRLVEPGEPVTEPVRLALRTARDAIRVHLHDPASESACAALNEVLAWGHSWPTVAPDGPAEASAWDAPQHRAGWLAAVNYVALLREDASRIRHCAHPDCVLYFYDTSPKRSRRWCSMAACGNRAKAARHYARARAGHAPG
ncbi:MAG TPA: CGNR zinc finger domain-containing protein [Pseudonocardia sp.]|uniref:CGNR zinc finger domain-containing protein n=1 Tax=Pseudonocardia sp. TaxID=60912 RepID=UPI002F3F88AC